MVLPGADSPRPIPREITAMGIGLGGDENLIKGLILKHIQLVMPKQITASSTYRPAAPVQFEAELKEVGQKRIGSRLSGYQFRGGLEAAHNGVAIAVEHPAGGKVDQAAAKQSIAGVAQLIDNAVPELAAHLRKVHILQGSNPADAYWKKKYGDKFTMSFATGGHGEVNYWNVGDPEYKKCWFAMPEGKQYAFDHELGHAASADGTAPRENEWRRAAQADAQNIGRLVSAGPLQQVQRGSLLIELQLDGKKAGISQYGEMSLQRGNASEDWSDSLAQFAQSRRSPEWVVQKVPGEAPRPLKFEDVFPNRTKIINGFLGAKR